MDNDDTETEAGDEISTEARTHGQFRTVTSNFRNIVDALIETFEGLTGAAKLLDSASTAITIRLSAEAEPADLDRIRAAILKNRDKDFFKTLMDDLLEISDGHTWGPRFILSFLDNFGKPKREPIFNSAMLTSAVAALETFFSDLARECYAAAPDSLHALPKEQQKEFSLGDLQKMKSVEDAVNIAIQRRVDTLSYGGLSEWSKFFKERLKVDILSLGAPEFTRELFERRHCIVHHGGRASARYVANVKKGEVGDDLAPDAGYVMAALDQIDLVGMQLAGATWRKFTKNSEIIFEYVTESSFEALRSSRWDYAAAMFEHLLQYPTSDADSLRTRVNKWISVKGRDGTEAIRADVEKWDVEPLSDLFVLARACLLDDLDFAFPLLAKLVENGDIAAASLATWPLFIGIRADSRISAFSAELDTYFRQEAENKPEEDAQRKNLDDDAP